MKLTPAEYADLIKRRPQLAPLGAVETAQPQPHARAALDRQPAPQARRSKGVAVGPRIRVTLIAFRRRLQDSDNSIASMKPLRDLIAAWLGLDDADDCIAWEYGQQLTRGGEGVAVRVERFNAKIRSGTGNAAPEQD